MKVICIKNKKTDGKTEYNLTIGKEYEARQDRYNYNFYRVRNDQGITRSFFKGMFQVVEKEKPSVPGNSVSLECINNKYINYKDRFYLLTIGKIYEGYPTKFEGFYKVMNDRGELKTYSKYLFKVIK